MSDGSWGWMSTRPHRTRGWQWRQLRAQLVLEGAATPIRGLSRWLGFLSTLQLGSKTSILRSRRLKLKNCAQHCYRVIASAIFSQSKQSQVLPTCKGWRISLHLLMECGKVILHKTRDIVAATFRNYSMSLKDFKKSYQPKKGEKEGKRSSEKWDK